MDDNLMWHEDWMKEYTKRHEERGILVLCPNCHWSLTEVSMKSGVDHRECPSCGHRQLRSLT